MSNYTEVSVSGYNSSPPPDDGSTGSDNEITWSGIKTKLTDPIKTAFDTCQDNITIAADAAVARVPVGVIWPYAGSSAPSGFLLCYGQAVSRTTYADLFTAISTTYGSGDGSTTFNVPDLRGRVAAGKDDMGGSSANRLTDANDGLNGDTLGDTGGVETQVLVQGNLPNVNFSAASLTGSVGTTITNGTNVRRGTGTDTAGAGSAVEGIPTNCPAATLSLASGTVTLGGSVPSGGSDTAFGVVQPTIILNYIIKY
jgi:microcystin-dependent protein